MCPRNRGQHDRRREDQQKQGDGGFGGRCDGATVRTGTGGEQRRSAAAEALLGRHPGHTELAVYPPQQQPSPPPTAAAAQSGATEAATGTGYE